ncbi:MAG: phthiocerol/phthiodiolone dimycocerosyl transferase family protein [Devosia sp.]
MTPELVRRGLDWLQDEHPILRAHAVRRGLGFTSSPPYLYRRVYFETRGTEPIPLRSLVDPDPTAGARVLQEELRRPIAAGLQPRMRAVLVRPSENAEKAQLIICVDHTIADANSAMRSIRQLLEFFADPDGAPPPRGRQSRLPPALDTAMPRKTASGRPYEPMIRLPVAKLPKSDVGTALEKRKFDKAETEFIKSQVKSHQTTLHGTIAAAVLTAIHHRFGVTELTCLSSVDLRRQCKPAVSMDTYGCYIDVLRTRHRIDQPLWALSRDVAFKLIAALARDHAGASALKRPTWEMIWAETVPLLKNRFRGDGLVITTAGEISLGRHYGPFILEEITGMISQETLGAGLFCLALEKQGELEISLCYAPHCLAQEDAAAIAEIAAASLRKLPG